MYACCERLVVLPLLGIVALTAGCGGTAPGSSLTLEAREIALDPPAPLNFRGYPCNRNCAGHGAGFRWAEAHGIDDPGRCGGSTESFREGCRDYAQQYR